MELMVGYKQTELGVIPEDWEASTIGSNSGWMSGGTPSRSNAEYWSGTVPWISGSTLKSVEISTSDQFLTPQAVVAGSKMAPVGSTLLLVRGSALHNEIRAGLVVAQVAFNQDVKALVPSATVEAKFLTYYILAHADELLKLVSSAGNSAGVLDTELVQNFKFLKPQVPEQRAIATALSDVDALLTKIDQLIAKKRDLKQAAMQQLLTGQTRLPGFSGEWDVKRLGDVADVDPENLSSGTAQQYGFKYISLEDVDVGSLRGFSEQVFATAPSRARRRLRVGDVLISTVRPNLMSHLLFKEGGADWICSTGFAVVRCHKETAHSGFIFAHLFGRLIARQIETLVTGSNYPALNSRDVRAFEIAMPSYSEQSAIATVLSDMDAELAALEARRDKTRALKQGMMQALLTGRIRLI